METPFNELSLRDLRQLEKCIETRVEVLCGLKEKTSRERLAIIALLPDGFSIEDQDKTIEIDCERCKKLLSYVRLLIREKRPQ